MPELLTSGWPWNGARRIFTCLAVLLSVSQSWASPAVAAPFSFTWPVLLLEHLSRQAVSQSPALKLIMEEAETTDGDFLSLLNVTTLAEARKLPSEAIIWANKRHITAAPARSYIFGAVKDVSIVTDQLDVLFARGEFDKSVKTMVSHNSSEASFFFDPNLETEEQFWHLINQSIPGLSEPPKGIPGR